MFRILFLPDHPWHQGVQCGPESLVRPRTNDKQNVQTEIYNDYFGIPIMQYEPLNCHIKKGLRESFLKRVTNGCSP